MTTSSKTDDLLALILWGLELLLRPYPHKLNQSFETWHYYNFIRPKLRQLERAKLLERSPGSDKTICLTAKGRLKAVGGIDAPQQWKRRWNGQWYLLLFDLPVESHATRVKLWRWLRSQRLGFLQKSVWLTPYRPDDSLIPLKRFKLTAESFTIVEGRPASPTTDADLVQSAWDFNRLNARYQTALDIAKEGYELTGKVGSAILDRWLAKERAAWVAALSEDPLLPEVLLPPDYLGRKAWEKRQDVFRTLAKSGTIGSVQTV